MRVFSRNILSRRFCEHSEKPLRKKMPACTRLGRADLDQFQLQSKPLNVITLGQRETDNINRMIAKTDCQFWEETVNCVR